MLFAAISVISCFPKSSFKKRFFFHGRCSITLNDHTGDSVDFNIYPSLPSEKIPNKPLASDSTSPLGGLGRALLQVSIGDL